MAQFWAGFVEGKIDTYPVGSNVGYRSRKMPALYCVKADAKLEYEDVRKVEIRVVSKKRKAKP